MDSSMTVATSDQEKLLIGNVNDYYLANEKIEIDQRDQWRIREGEESFDSILIWVTQLMSQFALEIRKMNMEISAFFSRKKIDEYIEAVYKVKKGIEDGTSVEKTVNGVDAGGGIVIGLFQLFTAFGTKFGAEGALALGHFRDSAISGATKYYTADDRQLAEIEKELGNKEKSLNDMYSQPEQIAKEALKEASRIYAELANVLALFIQKLQKVLSLERH